MQLEDFLVWLRTEPHAQLPAAAQFRYLAYAASWTSTHRWNSYEMNAMEDRRDSVWGGLAEIGFVVGRTYRNANHPTVVGTRIRI